MPTDTPGYIVARIEDKLGQHASDTAQILFEDVQRAAPNRARRGGRGLPDRAGQPRRPAASASPRSRSAWRAPRSKRRCAYAKERESFGKPIIEHQAVAFRLADMATQIDAARQLVLHAAALRDAGKPCLKEASMAKLFASEMAEKVCSDAIQIHGGYGYLNDFPVERIYRDVRVCQIYEGTSDIQRMVIARAL